MKENEHVAETRDWTRDIQIFSLTLSQLSYFGLFVVNFHVEIKQRKFTIWDKEKRVVDIMYHRWQRSKSNSFSKY